MVVNQKVVGSNLDCRAKLNSLSSIHVLDNASVVASVRVQLRKRQLPVLTRISLSFPRGYSQFPPSVSLMTLATGAPGCAGHGELVGTGLLGALGPTWARLCAKSAESAPGTWRRSAVFCR